MTLRLVPKDGDTVPAKVVVPVSDGVDFEERLAVIRANLNRINRLMAELRKMGQDGPLERPGAGPEG